MRDKARTQDEYRKAWQWHIEQIATLALAAKIEYKEYIETKQNLMEWLDKAIAIQLWDDRNG